MRTDLLKSWDELEPGDSLTFGRYPQTAEGGDATPIRWEVAEIRDGRALLVSKFILDCRHCYYAYDGEGNARFRAWEHTDLRMWLQSGFADAAFSAEERAALREIPGVGSGPPDLVSLPENGEAALPTAYVSSRWPGREKSHCWWTREEGPGRHSCVDQWLIGEDGTRRFDVVDNERGVRPEIRVSLPEAWAFMDCFVKRARPLDQSDALPGDVVSFGRYPKSGRPIHWVVLERRPEAALLLCEDFLTVAPYDLQPEYADYPGESDYVPWEACSLRAELNDEWLNGIFTEEERARTLVTRTDADPARPGSGTEDRLFLLSIEEGKHYLPLLSGKSFDNRLWWLRAGEDWEKPGAAIAETLYADEADDPDWDYVMEENDVKPAVWVRLRGEK